MLARRIVLAVLCAGWLGCAASRDYPEDPLLATKRPVEGKATAMKSSLLAFGEPERPPLPAEAFVLAPHHGKPVSPVPSESIAKNPAGEAPSTEEAPNLPRQDQPRVGAIQQRDVDGIFVSRLKAPGRFGHAPDYTWLQGIVDLTSPDRPELRYCDVGKEDVWGGRVILERDSRLGQFRSGDVIHVEGRVAAEGTMPSADMAVELPEYRVEVVRLVERKE